MQATMRLCVRLYAHLLYSLTSGGIVDMWLFLLPQVLVNTVGLFLWLSLSGNGCVCCVCTAVLTKPALHQ